MSTLSGVLVVALLIGLTQLHGERQARRPAQGQVAGHRPRAPRILGFSEKVFTILREPREANST